MRITAAVVEAKGAPFGLREPEPGELADDETIDRMMRHFVFDQIEIAARDAETGAVIKPVLRMH